MKILIIGGTGLISTAITRELLKRGEEVTLFNRGKTPQRFPEGARVIPGDRNNHQDFEQKIAQAGYFDCVIDMICFNKDHAYSDIRAFRGHTGHLIFCSTVNVYTKPAPFYPIKEDFPRVPINDDYGANKVVCEEIFFSADRNGDFPVTILRPAQTYGEGGVIIHTFGWSTTYLDRIRKKKPIVVHGDGTSLWNPCHIDDVALAFINAIGNRTAFGKAYHVTGEEFITWNQYHEKVAIALGAPLPDMVHVPTNLLVKLSPERCWTTYNNFQGNNVFDNSAARNDLEFRYRISWIDGVRRTVAWLDENGLIENSDDDPFDDIVIDCWKRYSNAFIEEFQQLNTKKQE